ncbi:MAG: hypothetical protein FJZ96_15355 [Chloroflexi bacterium]|nr:hypothetical protein [Chloroflexota bacterium]
MDEMTWELLVEVQGRLEAEAIKSLLQAEGIDTELFQESIGLNAFPVTVDGLGRVQIFVPKVSSGDARNLLADYQS